MVFVGIVIPIRKCWRGTGNMPDTDRLIERHTDMCVVKCTRHGWVYTDRMRTPPIGTNSNYANDLSLAASKRLEIVYKISTKIYR